MEVVAAAASVSALAELAITSYKSATNVFNAVRNAPHELSRVVQQLNLLHCELALLSDIEKRPGQSDELPLLSSEAALLERALSTAYELISDIANQLEKSNPHSGTKTRLKWALKNKAQVEGLLKDLKQTEASLNTVLLLVNVY
jgi:hypothetical protein